MFRNPRENSLRDSEDKLLPSIGRPPSPPLQNHGTRKENTSPHFSPLVNLMVESSGQAHPVSAENKAFKMQPFSVSKKTPQRYSNNKTGGLKQNQSILNFFGKSGNSTEPESAAGDDNKLFFEERGIRKFSDDESKTARHIHIDVSNAEESKKDLVENGRFNEFDSPVKRMKLDEGIEDLLVQTPPQVSRSKSTNVISYSDAAEKVVIKAAPSRKPLRHRGGFVDDSSSGEEEIANSPPRRTLDVGSSSREESNSTKAYQSTLNLDCGEVPEAARSAEIVKLTDVSNGVSKWPSEDGQQDVSTEEPLMPLLHREATSTLAQDEFDNLGDFEEDEFFEGGEELMERRWMEEQRLLEIGLDEDSKSESCEEGATTPTDPTSNLQLDQISDQEAVCPICGGSLAGITEVQASSHVNACLDGNPTTIPMLQGGTSRSLMREIQVNEAIPKRFQKAAVARPAQQNPFSLSKGGGTDGSAFSRIMSGHAEDAAWAEAANNEAQSRGRPAYQRTCPFYKIMPGFFICVDAFRYGKVENQNAYFLSHFHSDHYIGLTSSWCHGPIYCSRVTANLVRQQLRVDPKWVVALEFEKKVEVPNTQGAFVTMIPANHCPGSSLFLFEKATERGSRGVPKLTRILHCGDFRACPAHVNHPLLMSDVIDAVTGQTTRQIIDICYLDTTYLTPKYSFPSQGDVIDACAQMCVSLSKEIVDNSDAWEKAKLERAGSAMTKFLERPVDEALLIKSNDEDVKPPSRGRLLVVIGTYSIGKERMCLGIAKALDSKIYAPPAKMRICICLEDPELNARLTSNPLEAQVHMQTLMEIRAETLHDYLQGYKGHFARVVGFRPTGWNYRPPTSRFTENPAVSTVLNSDGWKSRFTMKDLAPGRGSTRESNCFGVPYSEHSSFRELTMFCCALRIGRVIPTVNVGSAKSREKMKSWIEKWELEKKKNGLFKVEVGADGWGSGDGSLRYGV